MTDTLAWDEIGSRYYETGVSRGTFFPIDGSTGVPWNGLVSIQIDPQGGDHEAYYFDGTKFMEKILAEDFQATIQAISTPTAFRPCEGVREYAPGMMTEMNKRDKFNMTWRTEISSDEGESIGYKLHVAYNNLVQPAGRNYQTIADTTTLDIRNFVITATPACGRHSYFWFDSREYDLSLIEAQILLGVLPKCYELPALVTPIDPDAPPLDPDEGCAVLIEDFERFNPGQQLSNDILNDDNGHPSITVHGTINNGLGIITLPAAGAYAANDSAASEVGTHPVLVDDDDATYITSADGDLGFTVGLPPLVGYVEGCAFELHIRMSITGGVNPDDPDNLDADAQVHISTDADGEFTVGGFSDGTDEGMGFALTSLDGTIEDYVVPLMMDAWVDTTLADVVAALEAGAYLDVVAVSNNNPDPADTPIEVNVYEASVVMLNTTDSSKSLRTYDPTDNAEYGGVFMDIYDTYPDDLVGPISTYVDFKVSHVVFNEDFDGVTILISECVSSAVDHVEITATAETFDLAWTVDTPIDLPGVLPDVWYRMQIDTTYSGSRLRISRVVDGVVVVDVTDATIFTPNAYAGFRAGLFGSSTTTWEVSIDNARMQAHCNEEPPAEAFTSDHYWTRGRLIRSAPGLTGSDEFVNIGPGTFLDIDFYNSYIGSGTTTNILYLVEIDGVEQPDPSWIPDNPGYELVRVQPWVEGYIVGDTRTSAALGTGYSPEPVKKPFLKGHVAGSYDLAWGESAQWLAWPGQRMFCGADDQLTHFVSTGLFEGQGMHDLSMEPVDSNTTHLVVNHVGMRLYWEPV